jgi:serine/threonine protein kinase
MIRLSGRNSPPAATRRGAADQDVIGKTVLGQYTLAGYLGEGSNSRVYVASQVSDPATPVVVKLVKEHLLANPRFRQFFDGEVQSMGRLTHPYAVRLLDASLDEPLGPCLVLDYIPGVTLEDLLRVHRRLPVERVAKLLGPLCHALQAAHDAGIVHRDLKPANLMVVNAGTPEESIRVMDFGFAGFTGKPHIQLADLTGVGPVYACGTPAYVSPEMVRGDTVDGRADLYSVAVILYEMIAGRLPFDRETQEEMIAAHIRDQAPRFNRIGVPGVPPSVEGVVQIALSKYPNERLQTAQQLCEQFGRALGLDLWADTAPAGYTPAPREEIVECTIAADAPEPGSPEDSFLLSDYFEANLTERLAAAKLRGFIEDVGAVPVASEPGLIRVHIDLPAGWKAAVEKPQGSGLFGWLTRRNPPAVKGQEPIELDLQMQKIDANRTGVLIAFRPLKEYMPESVRGWKDRCEGVYSILRRYLMAG